MQRWTTTKAEPPEEQAPGKVPREGDEVVEATEPPLIEERKPGDLPDLGGRID